MLVELHVVDLGIVADLDLVLGAGLTAITGETGAGKTLIVEAVELLVGGRADAALVRDGADRGARRGSLRASRNRRRDRAGPGRSRVTAAVAPTSTAGWRPRPSSPSCGADPRRSARPARAPVAARPRGSTGRTRPICRAGRCSTRSRRTGKRAPQCGRWTRDLGALGGDVRARAREIDLLRFQVDEIAAAELEIRTRPRRSKRRSCCSPTPWATGRH